MEKLVLRSNLNGNLDLELKNILLCLYDFYNENLNLAGTEKLSRIEDAISLIEEAIEIRN